MVKSRNKSLIPRKRSHIDLKMLRLGQKLSGAELSVVRETAFGCWQD